jgi:hypothetical protein
MRIARCRGLGFRWGLQIFMFAATGWQFGGNGYKLVIAMDVGAILMG